MSIAILIIMIMLIMMMLLLKNLVGDAFFTSKLISIRRKLFFLLKPRFLFDPLLVTS